MIVFPVICALIKIILYAVGISLNGKRSGATEKGHIRVLGLRGPQNSGNKCSVKVFCPNRGGAPDDIAQCRHKNAGKRFGKKYLLNTMEAYRCMTVYYTRT